MQRPTYVSLITYTAKSVARILRRRNERKIENVLGEHYFTFRRGKARDPSGILKKNIRTNLGHRRGNVCALHTLAEGI
jgi:hypothetical protein